MIDVSIIRENPEINRILITKWVDLTTSWHFFEFHDRSIIREHVIEMTSQNFSEVREVMALIGNELRENWLLIDSSEKFIEWKRNG